MKSSHYSLNKTTGSNRIIRYALPTGVGMLILSFALKTAGQMFYLICAVLFIIIGIFLCVFKNQKGMLVSAILLSLFCVRILSVITVQVENAYTNSGDVDNVTAVVTEAPTNYSSGSNYGACTVRIEQSSRKILHKGSLLLLKGDDVALLRLGDKISANIKLSRFEKKETALSYYSENVFMSGEIIDGLSVLESGKGIYGFAGKINSYVKKTLTRNTENYGTLLALITGDRSNISVELYEEVKMAGVSHVLVVSGMHLAILCGCLLKLLSAFKCSEILKDVLLCIFLFLMMCVCGFGMSMLRAGIVYVIAMAYRLLRRSGDAVLSLADAVMIVLFIHPFAAHSLAFQLSFASTYGILVLSRKIEYYLSGRDELNPFVKEIINAAAVSLSAYIATLPIVIYNFGYLSTYAIAVNVLVSLPSTVMLVLGVLGLVLGFAPFAQRILLFAADKIAEYFLFAVKLVNSTPLPTIPIRNQEILAISILILFVLIYILKVKPLRKFIKGRK